MGMGDYAECLFVGLNYKFCAITKPLAQAH